MSMKSVMPPELKVLPDTFWYADGGMKSVSQYGAIYDHVMKRYRDKKLLTVAELGQSELAEMTLDAIWDTEDGAQVRARLSVRVDGYAGGLRVGDEAGLREVFASDSLSASWNLTAVADRPWQENWMSPVTMMIPKPGETLQTPYRWYTLGALRVNRFRAALEGDWFEVLKTAMAKPWAITLITQASEHTVVGRAGTPVQEIVAAKVLPKATWGRVFQLMVPPGRSQLDEINRALAGIDVPELPEEGALVIQSPLADPGHFEVARIGSSMLRGAWSNVTDAVRDISAMPVTLTPQMRICVEDVMRQPPLTREEHQVRLAAEDALDSLAQAEAVVEAVQAALDEQGQKHQMVVDAFEAEQRETARALREIAEQRDEAQREVARLTVELGSDRLARIAELALEDRDEAQQLNERLLDEVDHKTRALQRARRLLAERGHALVEPTEEDQAVGTWEELIWMAQELLPHVVLGEIAGPVAKLKDSLKSQLWINKTWETLDALDAYARAQAGGARLPHFSAYLGWPEATSLIPVSRMALRETAAITTTLKYQRTRVFKVPHQVCAAGEVFMGAHVRIGGGAGQAPRLHFHDDTQGATGKIYVGYVGPHLPGPGGAGL